MGERVGQGTTNEVDITPVVGSEMRRGTSMVEPMIAVPVGKWLDRGRLSRLADGLVVAVAMSLPWSTSATGILIALWLLAVLPSLDFAAVRREVLTYAGGLPVLLWLLGVLGMAWADVPWAERLDGLSSFHRLLVIPLLLAQLRRSGQGRPVLIGFLISAVVLLGASVVHAILWLIKAPWISGTWPGVPVKDYVAQSSFFLICFFGLLGAAVHEWRDERPIYALSIALLALLFLADISYVATGRTELVVVSILTAVFGLRYFGWKGTIGVLIAAAAFAAVVWASSPLIRIQVGRFAEDIRQYQASNVMTSSGIRLEFWRKSIAIVAQAPIIGHGTGTIYHEFVRASADEDPAIATVTNNPHQQILTVAVQIGLLGAAVLLAMWTAHLALFRGSDLAAWIGLVVVAQNIISSLFNSHLFDFTHGWLYVFGVGVIGGMVLHQRSRPPRSQDQSSTRPGS
jgi:O-antigen ligase